jgi:hypothetical protein
LLTDGEVPIASDGGSVPSFATIVAACDSDEDDCYHWVLLYGCDGVRLVIRIMLHGLLTQLADLHTECGSFGIQFERFRPTIPSLKQLLLASFITYLPVAFTAVDKPSFSLKVVDVFTPAEWARLCFLDSSLAHGRAPTCGLTADKAIASAMP